jgi:hypothetical protein
VLVLIGYDIRFDQGHHHFLARNSWGDAYHYWRDFYEWYEGCRVAWPNYDPSGPDINYFPNAGEVEVAYSGSFFADLSGTYTVPHGDIYLGSEFITKQVPRLADPLDDPLWRDRPGYLIGSELATNTAHLYGLRAGGMQIERIWKIEAAGLDVSRLGPATAGAVPGDLFGYDAAPISTVFIYEQPFAFTAGQTDADVQPASGRLLIGAESHGGYIDMTSAGELLGAPAPRLADTKMLYLSRLGEVMLMGRPVGSELIEAWKLRLIESSWDGPHRLSLDGSLSDYAATYDPVRGKVYLIGGQSEAMSAAPRPNIYELRPTTMEITAARVQKFVPAELAAGKPSVHLDSAQGQLHIYGRQSGQTSLGQLWRMDLSSGGFTQMSGAAGPGFDSPPFLFHDGYRNKTWLASFQGKSIDEPLPVSVLGRDGQWLTAEKRVVGSEPDWPVTATHIPGMTRAYPWSVGEGYELPGQPLISTIQSTGGAFGISAVGQRGDILARSLPTSPETEQLAIVCPPGEVCLFKPQPRISPAEAAGREYIVDVEPADVSLEATSRPRGRIRDLEAHGQYLYAAGPWGLAILGQEPSLSVLEVETGWQTAGLTSIEVYKGYLYASRLRVAGLAVFDVSAPSAPAVIAQTPTLGVGWDVALSKDRGYVAHGIFGIGIYDISNPRQPQWESAILWIGGRTVAVAANRDLLAVGRAEGRVILYDISGEPKRLGQIDAKGRLSRLAFRNGRLWVLGKRSNWVEIFDVTDPAAPTETGEVTAGGTEQFHSRLSGSWAYTFQGREVRGYRFQPQVDSEQ